MMNPKARSFRRVGIVLSLAATALVLAMLVVLGGCSKEQPAAHKDQTSSTSSSQPATKQQPQQTPQAGEYASQTSTDQPAATTVAAEQTTCPVMEGNPINKAIFVEYKGKKVYFCCPACPEKFLANPEKYIAKLPQFKQ